MRRERCLVGFVLVSTMLGCASSRELARRSEEALAAHDYERAYREASAALDKDPANPRAKGIMSLAATHLIDEREQHIANLAATDTVAAADEALELDAFRTRVLAYNVTLPADESFAAQEIVLKEGAAAILYRRGRTAERERSYKQAYRSYRGVRRFVATYRDLETRLPKVHELALERVAILPFNDETGLPAVGRELADHMHDQLDAHVKGEAWEFTRLIAPDKVDGRITLAKYGDLDRDDAVQIGRALGARAVVWGRYRGLHSEVQSDHFYGTLFRKVVERDTAGRNVERFIDVPFSAIDRRRDVWVRWEYEIIDVDDEASLGHDGDEISVAATTVYTDFVPEGSCDAYCLYPAPWKKSDAGRCDRLDADWHGTFGGWSVPRLLERAKRDHGRTRYRREFRGEFADLNGDYPVFMDDLPTTGDLVYVALDDIWRKVLDGLREVEARWDTGH